MRYIIAFWLISIASKMAFADCKFVVINDSFIPIQVEAGYFNGGKESFIVPNASSRNVTIKNDNPCGDINSARNLTYVNLIGGQSQGGWIYETRNQRIRAIGEMRDKTSVIGLAPNGREIVLSDTGRPSLETFTVKIKSAQSTSRQNGSLND